MKNNSIIPSGVVMILLALALSSHGQDSKGGKQNLLSNETFAKGMEGWKTTSNENKGTAVLDNDVKRGETPSLRITNPSASDTFCKQEVKVQPGMRYRLSAYIKTKEVDVKGGQAATLSLGGTYERSKSLKGSESWQKVELEFDSGALDKVTVGCRLGGWHSLATGIAWFDDLKMIEVGKSKKR